MRVEQRCLIHGRTQQARYTEHSIFAEPDSTCHTTMLDQVLALLQQYPAVIFLVIYFVFLR